jgi:uncharacterized protein (DUF983 family)
MGFSFKAMWNYKCPRCRQGDIFVKPLVLTNPLDMPKNCAVCGQATEPEPGFYYGAMFLSYILGSWYILLPTLLLVFYFKWSVEAAMGAAIALGVVSYLRILRGSRSLYFHMMVSYDPEAAHR